jgi:hypothetical protein
MISGITGSPSQAKRVGVGEGASGVDVSVRVAVAVGVDDSVGVRVAVGLAVEVGVALGVGVRLTVTVAVHVTLAVGVTELVGAAVGTGVGVGEGEVQDASRNALQRTTKTIASFLIEGFSQNISYLMVARDKFCICVNHIFREAFIDLDSGQSPGLRNGKSASPQTNLCPILFSVGGSLNGNRI